jgi:hypothetical protein
MAQIQQCKLLSWANYSSHVQLLVFSQAQLPSCDQAADVEHNFILQFRPTTVQNLEAENLKQLLIVKCIPWTSIEQNKR